MTESGLLNEPHKVEGAMESEKQSFYELAKQNVKYLTNKEVIQWHKETSGRENFITLASHLVDIYEKVNEDQDIETWVRGLEVVVNEEIFTSEDMDYRDLIPFVVEHEIYEAWLSVKKGIASTYGEEERHALARRKEFLVAEEQGLGDKLLAYYMLAGPEYQEECENALASARKKLKDRV